MWVSRREWESVLERIQRLEQATALAVTDTGIIYKSWYGSEQVPINEVVDQLASKLKLRRTFKCAKYEFLGEDK